MMWLVKSNRGFLHAVINDRTPIFISLKSQAMKFYDFEFALGYAIRFDGRADQYILGDKLPLPPKIKNQEP